MLARVGENLMLMRRPASGQRVLCRIRGIGFAVGLAAHIGGFPLETPAPAEPMMLVIDPICALGWALRTGVVVVLFVQIWPEVKRRQYWSSIAFSSCSSVPLFTSA